MAALLASSVTGTPLIALIVKSVVWRDRMGGIDLIADREVARPAVLPGVVADMGEGDCWFDFVGVIAGIWFEFSRRLIMVSVDNAGGTAARSVAASVLAMRQTVCEALPRGVGCSGVGRLPRPSTPAKRFLPVRSMEALWICLKRWRRSLSKPRRVLFIGYSVTELNGYVERVQELLGEQALVARSGWGGHTIDTIAYMIDSILDADSQDEVVLELFTSHIRTLGIECVRVYLDEILTAHAQRRLPIRFLLLYDSSVDYRSDDLTGLVRDYSTRFGIPILDLATEVAAMRPEERTPLFKDFVHSTDRGATLYGERIVRFLAAEAPGRSYIGHYEGLARRFRALSVADLVPMTRSFILERNGTPFCFLEIDENEEVVFHLPEPARVVGALLTYAPQSGEMIFSSERENVRIMPYDPHSYYIRSGAFNLDIYVERELRVFQTPIASKEMPLKGEKHYGPRIGRISHIFCALADSR